MFAGAALLAPRRLSAPRRSLVRALGGRCAGRCARRDPGRALRGRPAARRRPGAVARTRPAGRGSSGIGSCSRSRSRRSFLYSAAAVGFLIRAERERDVLLLWVALSAALSALARLNYFLFPSLYSEWVYAGDFFRIAGYLAPARRDQSRDARLPARRRGRGGVRGAPPAGARASRRPRAGARVHPQRGGTPERHRRSGRDADGHGRRARPGRGADGHLRH